MTINHFFPAGARSVLVAILSLVALSAADPSQTTIAVEALRRLKGTDLEANPTLKAAVLRVLEQARGTPHFVELVRDFGIRDQGPALLEYALDHPAEAMGVEALRLVLAEEGPKHLEPLLQSERAPQLIQVLGNSPARQTVPLLEQTVLDLQFSPELRREAVAGLARSEPGALRLLELARAGRLPSDVLFRARTELDAARWPAIRREASALLPPPRTQHAEPLPPLAELLERPGNPVRGAEVYAREEIGCNRCHQVRGEGVDFGPNLSEIGDKLGKDALYQAILDPNGGISFGYEGWRLELADGDEAFGILLSETAEEVALKTQTGIVFRYPRSSIVHREKSRTSIMPEGLQELMATQDLVDLVEYLSTLRK